MIKFGKLRRFSKNCQILELFVFDISHYSQFHRFSYFSFDILFRSFMYLISILYFSCSNFRPSLKFFKSIILEKLWQGLENDVCIVKKTQKK